MSFWSGTKEIGTGISAGFIRNTPTDHTAGTGGQRRGDGFNPVAARGYRSRFSRTGARDTWDRAAAFAGVFPGWGLGVQAEVRHLFRHASLAQAFCLRHGLTPRQYPMALPSLRGSDAPS